MEKKTILPGENPGSYTSRWEQQLEEAALAILNRPDFRYDAGSDALYNQYRDRYIQQGRQAMMDTMGQAAALTGGYGNSYAQLAGQQAYGTYLQGVNDLLPQLYQLALDSYITRGQDLSLRYDTLAGQEAMDYDIYRDQVSDWQYQQKFDEDKRRYDQEWEYKLSRGGRGGGGSGEHAKKQKAAATPTRKPNNLNTTTNYLK